MATYYVRKSGNDSNTTVQAQDPATPWLTIDKAANEVAAGDTVYVGAGVYREQVTMDTSGSSGSQISFIADVDGSNGSGDPGLVIISAYTTEDAAATRASCLDPNEKDYITWRGFVMTGGTAGVVYKSGTGNINYEGCVWEDCVFVAGHVSTDYAMFLNFNAATTPTNNGPTIRRCTFVNGSLRLSSDGNEVADQDLKIVIESCLLYPNTQSASTFYAGVMVDIGTAGTYGSGGVDITNCSFSGGIYGVYVEHGISSTYPVAVRNCYFRGTRSGLTKQTSNDGALTSDFNLFGAVLTDYAFVTAGSNDANTLDPGLLGGISDAPLYRYWGWSPFRPWEPIRLQDDAYIHAVIGAGDTSVAPAFDLYNENRPMYGTVDDVGAVEGRARPEQETTTVRTGSNSVRFEGAGYHDIILPVTAALTTVDVYAQYDATYAGTLPQLKALNIPGVADQTDTQTGGSGSFEKLTVTFTPTAAGIARIRLQSNDTSAAGECFFDDLAVS